MDKFSKILEFDSRVIARNKRINSHLEDYISNKEVDAELTDASFNTAFINEEGDLCEESHVQELLKQLR